MYQRFLWMFIMVRQAKLGASYRVQVPVGQGLTIHPYRVLRLWRHNGTCGSDAAVCVNKRGEAYTENLAGQRGGRTTLK